VFFLLVSVLDSGGVGSSFLLVRTAKSSSSCIPFLLFATPQDLRIFTSQSGMSPYIQRPIYIFNSCPALSQAIVFQLFRASNKFSSVSEALNPHQDNKLTIRN
jgi:hypothetical protein